VIAEQYFIFLDPSAPAVCAFLKRGTYADEAG
jgi:hypothetical protein